MFKNKFKRFIATLMSLVMIATVLPLQTLAAEWGVGDNVYAAMLGDYIGSDGGTYGDKRNYTYIYYKSDGSTGTATRYASTHAKLGVSKNGITQQAICIEAGVSYSIGSSYVGEDNSNTYLRNLPLQVRDDIKIALLCGFNSDTKSSPVSGTNLDDFSFATQIIVWEIQQQLRTEYNKSDLKANKWGTPAKVYYEQLQGRPAEKCYDYILGKMKAYSVVPSFTGRAKVTAPTHTLKYNSSTKKYSITLTDDNKSGMPASAFNISGVTVTKSGNKYTFSTTSKISGTKACTYKANRTTGKQLVVWKSSGGDFQTMADGIDDPVQFYANFKTSDLGSLRVTKKWDSADTLTNAEIIELNKKISFTVKNSNGKYVMSKSTSSAGVYNYSGVSSTAQKYKLNESSKALRIDNLPAGTYIITEICTIDNYEPTQTTQVFNVKAGVTSPASTTTTFTNEEKTATAHIAKSWVSADELTAEQVAAFEKQVYFTVKDSDGKYLKVNDGKADNDGWYVYDGTQDSEGKFYLNNSSFRIRSLPLGTYTVTEYNSADSYSPSRQTKKITLSSDGETKKVSFTNEQKTATAHIAKSWVSADELTAEQVAAFEKQVYFTVKDSDGKYLKVNDGKADNDGWYVYDGTQDTEGKFYLKNSSFRIKSLPLGTYTVTEYNSTGFSPAQQTKTLTLSKDGETKKAAFINKSIPVVVIRKHFSDEDNLTEAQLKEQYAKVIVNLQVLGFSGSASSNPPAGYYVEFTGSNGNYTYKGISSTKTSAADLKLNENGEMTISFGTNTAPYYLAVIETYSGTEYDVDNRDQRIDLGNGDPNAVIDLDDIELDNQLKTGSVQIDKEFLNENGAVENITDKQLAEVSFKIMHNGKYLTFTGSDGIYTYKGENESGTELKLNKATYNFIASELPAREQYTVTEVSGATGYSFSIDPVTFEVTPNGTVKKVFTNKAMTGTISVVKHSADGVLSGWKFRVYGTALTGQKYDKTFTTDADGKITVADIRIGNYKVTEVKTGKTVGYITENSKDLEVKTDTVTTVNFENKPYANIVINKVDAKTGEKVTGATFGIYTDAECEIPAQAYTSATDKTLTDAVITESATGKYTCNFLPIESKDGTKYYVKELTAPEGYYLDTNAHAVTLKTANATVSVSNEIGLHRISLRSRCCNQGMET